jgi:hypothetical protein
LEQDPEVDSLELDELSAYKKHIEYCCYIPDIKSIAVGWQNGNIGFFDLDGTLLGRFSSDTNTEVIKIKASGEYLAVFQENMTCIFSRGYKKLASIPHADQFQDTANGFEFIQRDEELVVVRPDGYAFTLDLTGKIVSKTKIEDKRIVQCAFSSSGEYLVIKSSEKNQAMNISLWDSKFRFVSHLFEDSQHPINSLSFCRGNEFIYAGDDQGGLQCVSLDGKRNWRALCSPHVPINVIDSSNDMEKVLVEDGESGEIFVVENYGDSVIGIIDCNYLCVDEVFIGFNENASAILSLTGNLLTIFQYSDWKHWLSRICSELCTSSCQNVSEEVKTEYGRIACEICQQYTWRSEK